MEKVTVLGAGSWGTALAGLLGEKGFEVSLWVRGEDLSRSIAEKNENTVYLPGVRLSENIKPSSDLKQAIKGSKIIVSAIPSHGLRGVLEAGKAYLEKGAVIVSATKGIEDKTYLTASGIIKDVLGSFPFDTVILSGPSFAKEVSIKLPAAVCAASESAKAASLVQQAFSTPQFRVYTNPDVAGVELGGALKNVIAIASGISDGLGLGNNARAALITRGLAEITRLGISMGANPLTFSGLSGLGDLVLTCTGPLSRNYTVGVEIGRGKTTAEATGSMKMIAEGVRTSKAASELSRLKCVEMPITEAVNNIIYKGKPPKEAVMDLMLRELKGE